MDSLAAATASADAVATIGSHFMLDGNTYKRGAELGFAGLDFYITGRGGVLGDVDADVVTAALAFFAPAHVRAQWDAGRKVMPAHQAAQEFAGCGATWAEEHVPDEVDAARLAELAGKVVAGARTACAPIFGGWRALPVPDGPKQQALHHMNALRELRFGLHAAAVISAGLAPLEAMTLRSPHMIPLFGWEGPVEVDGRKEIWDAAEAQTNVAMAHAFDALDDSERDELVELANALHQAVAG